MNPDREPISPPTSPVPNHQEEEEGIDSGDISDSNCGDPYIPANDSDAARDDEDDDDEDDDDDDDHNDSDVPSSPPTSVETGSKGDQRMVSGHTDISIDGYRAPAVETEDEDEANAPREYFTHYENGNDTFSAHRKNWEGGSSQWEDEDGSPAHALSSPPLARVQSQSSSRKSPAPSSPMFPPRPRQTNSAKSHLSHQFSHRRSPASRASSGSYDHRELHRDEKKPPLVLLHVTLLLLPGAEEVVLRHLTPTTLERGVLVEHPRGDYNLLEELILDGLGLDDDYVSDPTETEEPAEKTWEQALNIAPTSPVKKAWQLRVYASNGLMTPGAWKRVWAEMERIDVEIWPRGYDRNGRSNRSSVGGHSRGTSTSSVLPYPSDAGMVDELEYVKPSNGSTRHSSNSILASSAPVPISPPRARTPTTTPKSRRVRSRAPAAGSGFDFNKMMTPKAVMVYAGINLLLFLYFTVFRFVDFGGAWSSVMRRGSGSGGGGVDGGVMVQEMPEERCPVEISSEGCGVPEVAMDAVAVEPEPETEGDVDVDGDVEVEVVDTENTERVLIHDETIPDPDIVEEEQEQEQEQEQGQEQEQEQEQQEQEQEQEEESDSTTPSLEDTELRDLDDNQILDTEAPTAAADDEEDAETPDGGVQLDLDLDLDLAEQQPLERDETVVVEATDEETAEESQLSQEEPSDAPATEEALEEALEEEEEVLEKPVVEEKGKYSFFKGLGFS